MVQRTSISLGRPSLLGKAAAGAKAIARRVRKYKPMRPVPPRLGLGAGRHGGRLLVVVSAGADGQPMLVQLVGLQDESPALERIRKQKAAQARQFADEPVPRVDDLHGQHLP